MDEKYSQWLREFDEMSMRQLKAVEKAVGLWHQQLLFYKEYYTKSWGEKYQLAADDVFHAYEFIQKLIEREDKPERIKKQISEYILFDYSPHKDIRKHIEFGYGLRDDEVKNLQSELCNAQKHIEMFKDLYESEKGKSNGKQTKKLTTSKKH